MIDINFGRVFGRFLDCSFKVSSIYCGLQEIHEIECFGVMQYSKVEVKVIGDDYHISQNNCSYMTDSESDCTFDDVLFGAIHDAITRDSK